MKIDSLIIFLKSASEVSVHQQIKLRYLCHFISSPLTRDAAVWWPAGKVILCCDNSLPLCGNYKLSCVSNGCCFLLNKTSRVYAHIVLEVNQLKAVFLLNRSEIYSSFKRDC